MATTFRTKVNYPSGIGSLNADISSSTLTVVLSAGQGSIFPSSNFTVTIDEEILLIDSRSTDTLTVNASGRGYGGTTAAAHAAASVVANYQIKEDFTAIETAVNALENILGGVNPILDDTYLRFGTDSDIRVGYDETTDDRLEWTDGTNLLAYLKDLGSTGMWGVTGRAEIPQIGISSDTDLLTLTADLLTVAGDVAVNGGDITSTQTTFNLLNATVTSGNLFGAVTTGVIGAATGTMTIRNATVRFGNASAATQIAAVNVAAAQFASFQFQTAGSFRWSLLKENTSESGSDAGSNFELRAGTDAGALIDSPITIARASGGAMVFGGSTNRPATFNGALTVNGNGTFGDASTDTYTHVGRCVLRAVTDAGPMTATPGTAGEIVRNTSDNKFYGCTVTHATAATWVALN